MEPIGRRPAVRLRQLLLWAWIIAGVVQVRAAHVLGGNITYVCLGGNNFQVNLGLFYDCTGVAALPQTLTFTSACGTQSVVVPAPAPVEVSQICPSQLANSSCNGGSLQGVNLYNFQITVNLPPCPGGWLISWVLCCRAPTLNLVAAPGTYVEAVLRNDLAPCTDSPQFAEQSVPYICVGEEFNFNFGVTAAPGHNLIYSLIGARGFATTSAPVNYQAGFSGTVPVPGTTIDPFSGQISFTPGAIGKYVFVVQVDQYDANGVFIGSVMRDIMLIAMPCNSVPPVVQGFATLSGPNDGVLFIGNNTIEVCHGAPFCFDLVFADPNVGDVLSISSQAATLLPGSSVVVAGTNPMTVTVCWAGDVAHSPVNLLMQVNDGACPVINTSTVGVTITSVVPTGSQPYAGLDATVQVCPTALVFDLVDELGGSPDPGGFWMAPDMSFHGPQFNPATDPPGTYLYVAGNACANDTAQLTIAFTTNLPDAGISGALNLCGIASAVALVSALGGTPDVGGAWTHQATGTPAGSLYDPLLDVPGVFVYTVSGVSGCADATATVTVTEQNAPDAGADNTITLCDQGAPTNLFTALNGTPDAGGTWSGPSAIAGGMYDPSVHTAGTYTYTIAATAPCASASSTVTVTIQTAPDAGTGNAVALCNSGSPVNLFGMLTGSPQAGGTWTGPDGNVITGVVDPATGVNGSYTYTLAASVICPSQAAVVLLTISSAVDAGEDTLLTICSSESPVDLFTVLGGTPDSGGIWTQQSDGTPFGGLFDPSISNSGTYGYAMAAGAPCPSDTAVVQVIVFLDPDAGSDSMGVLCSTDMPISLATMLSIQVGTDGIWLDPAGSLASPLFDPAGSAPGAYLYILPATGTCPGDTAVVDIGVVAATVAGSNGDTTVCSNGGSFALIDLLGGTPDPGGIWTAPDGSVSNGLLHAPSALEGVYTYMVTAPAPCPPSTATVEVVILMPPVIAPVLAVTDGCAPVQVILESGYLGTGSCHWDLGNGMDTTGCGPLTYIYAQPGVHQVVLMVDPDNDCGTTVNVGMPVVVAEEPVASFSIQDDPGHRDQPVVSMINTSMGATGYLWDFGGWGTSTLAEPTFAFPYGTEERQTICLTALASPACVDTACMNWLLPAGATVFVPNAFTPDGDGRNDGFAPRTSGMDPEGFLFFIVDRWGQTLYSTEDMHASWDGTLRNGDPAPPGVYVWKLTGHESRVVRRIERTGHVTLLR